jgi:hypothetical protein
MPWETSSRALTRHEGKCIHGVTVPRVLNFGTRGKFVFPKIQNRTRDSAVGIATRYGLEGPGIESRCGVIFHTYPYRLRGPPSLLYNGYRVFPGGKGGRGVMLTTHPLLVPRLRKSWAIPPLTLWVLLGLLRGSLFYNSKPQNRLNEAYCAYNAYFVCFNLCDLGNDTHTVICNDKRQQTVFHSHAKQSTVLIISNLLCRADSSLRCSYSSNDIF